MVEVLQTVDFLNSVFDSLAVKDFALGFFMALALRRGRISALIGRMIPSQSGGEGNE